MQIGAGTDLPARALLFDMDGTLVNSTPVIVGLWRRWAARHGVDPEALLSASPGRRAIETVRMFAPAGMDVVAEAASLAKAAGEETEGLAPIPGASALLHSLPRGCWAVVTSAERVLAERWMLHAGLPLPDLLIAAEDVAAGKPDPAGFLRAAALLGCPPAEAVAFEDAPAGLVAGQAAGVRLIAIATTLPVAELEPYEWLPDFTQVSFGMGRQGRPVLRVGA